MRLILIVLCLAASPREALAGNVTLYDASVDIGKKLDDKWAAGAASASQSAYIGAATKGVDSLIDIKKEIQDPTLGNAASLLQDAGSIAALLPFPPAAQMIGIGLYAIGGIMKIFDPAPEPPSNADVISSINSAFVKLGAKIDKVGHQVEAAIAAVGRLQATVDMLGDYIEAIFDDIHLNRKTMQKIDSVYVTSMERLNYALGSPNHTMLMEDFKDYVKLWRNTLSDEVHNTMAPSNIRASLLAAREHKMGCSCSAALTFQSHMATRWKLYWIMSMGSFFQNGASAQILGYTQQLKSDMADYTSVAVEMQIDDLVKRRDTELSVCLDTYKPPGPWIAPGVPPQPWSATTVVPGLDGTNGCGTGYYFVDKYPFVPSKSSNDCYQACVDSGMATDDFTEDNIPSLPLGCYAARRPTIFKFVWNSLEGKEGRSYPPPFVPVCAQRLPDVGLASNKSAVVV